MSILRRRRGKYYYHVEMINGKNFEKCCGPVSNPESRKRVVRMEIATLKRKIAGYNGRIDELKKDL